MELSGVGMCEKDFAFMTTQERTVSGELSFDTKERVKQAIDIVDLVGSHIALRRQGRIFVGLCPWHDDTRPSLQVNPDRQSFKCWVCDVGGDVFSFVMKMEGVEFREALQMLADRAGITVERPKGHGSGGAAGPHIAPAGFDKRTLYKAAAWAERQYHECLLDAPEAEPARRYLAERKITAESIEKFNLGFSPTDGGWLLQKTAKPGEAARSTNRAKILEAVGVLSRPAGGGPYYDRFRGRLLFSIRDAQNRPVGIGGRILPELGIESRAKYVNSPETPLFTKSKLLYGLDLAKDTLRRSGTALIMEGYTDVIVAHQYGFTNAVAVLGTALGPEHIRNLKHYTDRIILVLDGDEAGQKRTNEVLELFVAQQVDLRILTLPEGLDPCDFLHERGPEAFQELLDTRAVDALDHAFATITKGVDVDRDVHAASQALDRLIAIVAKAPRLSLETTGADRFREQKILQRLASHFRIEEREVRRRLTALRRKSIGPAGRGSAAGGTEKPDVPEAIDPCQRELMELLTAFPVCFDAIQEKFSPDWLGQGACRRIYDLCCELAGSGATPDFDHLMIAVEDPTLKNLLVAFDEAGRAKQFSAEELAQRIVQLQNTFQEREVQRQRPAQREALRQDGADLARQSALLEQILRQERDRHGVTKPTDG
jgi:DNA primase